MEDYTRTANTYRYAADTVTYSTTALAGVMAYDIALAQETLGVEYQSWGMLSTAALFGVLDRFDGFLARRSERHGRPITDKDKAKDPFHDKVVTHLFMGSVVLRETALLEGFVDTMGEFDPNYPYAAAVFGAQVVTAVRDKKMTESRAHAVESADTSAITINKQKTGVQNVAHACAASPLAATIPGALVTSGLYIMSTVMGVVGYKRADKIHKGQLPIAA